MNGPMWGGALAIFGGGLWASGVFEGGEVYDQPVAQVYSTLSYMPMPDELKTMVKNVPGGEVRVTRIPNQSVSWRFTQGGHPIATFHAKLSPSGASSTQVDIEFEPGEDTDVVNKELVSLPMVAKFAEIAMAEQVDSQLEKRPFDQTKVSALAVSYALSNSEEVIGSIEKVHDAELARVRAAGEDKQREKETEAVKDAAPMTDLSQYNK